MSNTISTIYLRAFYKRVYIEGVPFSNNNHEIYSMNNVINTDKFIIDYDGKPNDVFWRVDYP